MAVTDRSDLLSAALELSVYRVIQEALTNVVKHAPGAWASVAVAISAGQVCIDIADDGMSANAPRRTVTQTSVADAGSGFRVVARIPVQGGG